MNLYFSRIARAKAFGILGITAVVISADAGEFENLDFEQARTNNLLYSPVSGDYISGQGSVTDLLPGWQFEWFGSTNVMFFNGLANEPVGYTLVSRDALEDPEFKAVFPLGIAGRYAFAVNAGEPPVRIFQVGYIPSYARILRLDLQSQGGKVAVLVNGQAIPTTWTGQALEGDISLFAGTTAQLELQFFQDGKGLPPASNPTIGIDSLAFVVPEPGTVKLSILVVGGFLLICKFTRNREQ